MYVKQILQWQLVTCIPSVYTGSPQEHYVYHLHSQLMRYLV